MKKIQTPEQVLEFFEKESSDRIIDRIEYNERVIIPAMKAYASQFELSDNEIDNSKPFISDLLSYKFKEGMKFYREQLRKMREQQY